MSLKINIRSIIIQLYKFKLLAINAHLSTFTFISQNIDAPNILQILLHQHLVQLILLHWRRFDDIRFCDGDKSVGKVWNKGVVVNEKRGLWADSWISSVTDSATENWSNIKRFQSKTGKLERALDPFNQRIK